MSKKVVILVVLLECILAILLVSFFGKVIEETRRDVLCKEIYFVNEYGMKIEDDVPIVVELDTLKPTRYKLQWNIVAKNTTNKMVQVEFSDDGAAYIGYDKGREELVISPDLKKSIVITVRVMDGSEKTDTITLIPKMKTESDAEI